MLRFIKRRIRSVIDWFLYSLLKTEQKERLANLFTDKQKEFMKKVIKPGKKRIQMQRVNRVKYRLTELGFIERGLEELVEIYEQEDDTHLSFLAGWQLAVWYANQDEQENAQKSLDILASLYFDPKDKGMQRRKSIIEAECYQRLGQVKKAKQIISRTIKQNQHVDLWLTKVNLETDVDLKIQYINQIMDDYGTLKVAIKQDETKSYYDNLTVNKKPTEIKSKDVPKVSIIIPAYNAADIIDTAIQSMLDQTWSNIEVIVVDDCSTDDTFSVIKNIASKDSRIKVAQTETNSGAYVARNTALGLVTGEFVTINDADDWSHPEKIETQVKHLLDNPNVIANTSQQARITEDLEFYRRGRPGEYVFSNMSSFMFRQAPVLEKLGFWDSVRFAGDSEFIKRIKLIFGEKAVVTLDTAPLSFSRQTSTSLTGDSVFGFPGFFMGVRKEYAESHNTYHQQHPDQLYYPFPQKERPYPVPEPMWPTRAAKDEAGYRHFDVIIASEFRLLGGTNMSNIEEINAQAELGLKTGLVQMNRYDLTSVKEMNPKVRELIDGDQVQMICYGEKVTCDVLILRHPPVLTDTQKYIPTIKAKQIKVIINQTPKREYSDEGTTLYDLKTTANQLKHYFGAPGKWYPIGPVIREALTNYHASDLEAIQLSSDDWVNIINVAEWQRDNRPTYEDRPIRIGRHSRSQYVKWPNSPEGILQVYPESSEYEIHVLGGADAPEKTLGRLPTNWHVAEFGEQEPRDFLANLDVFVYYTHPQLVEAFGRVMLEAMAAGVPVIIPPIYQALFGEAAIYCEPSEVEGKIKQLMNNPAEYQKQVDKAQQYVEEHFGYTKHAQRLELNVDVNSTI